MSKDFEIFATIALIFLVVYLNKKEQFNYFASRFFAQLFAITTRRITKKAYPTKKAGH